MIYKEPTIYKSGEDIQKEFNANFIELKPKVLDKYKSYINYTHFENQKIVYNKLSKIFVFGSGLEVTSSFTPNYSNTDIEGDNDWPVIAYFEIPSSFRDVNYASAKISGYPSLETWCLTSYVNDLVCIRLSSQYNIIPGWCILHANTIQLI
jgi:hypothetical protein